MKESDLYKPIKKYLENLDYTVKGEIKDCDIVAIKNDGEPVIIELKTRFTLQLLFQAIKRKNISDHIYLAFPLVTKRPGNSFWNRHHKDAVKLCRYLGLGLITVYFGPKVTRVDVHCEPGPYQPRKNKRRQASILREFKDRKGDPNRGGRAKNGVVITAYRQQATELLQYLNRNGATKASIMKNELGIEKARNILYDNHYGWFSGLGKGIYELSPKGKEATTEPVTFNRK